MPSISILRSDTSCVILIQLVLRKLLDGALCARPSIGYSPEAHNGSSIKMEDAHCRKSSAWRTGNLPGKAQCLNAQNLKASLYSALPLQKSALKCKTFKLFKIRLDSEGCTQVGGPFTACACKTWFALLLKGLLTQKFESKARLLK